MSSDFLFSFLLPVSVLFVYFLWRKMHRKCTTKFANSQILQLIIINLIISNSFRRGPHYYGKQWVRKKKLCTHTHTLKCVQKQNNQTTRRTKTKTKAGAGSAGRARIIAKAVHGTDCKVAALLGISAGAAAAASMFNGRQQQQHNNNNTTNNNNNRLNINNNNKKQQQQQPAVWLWCRQLWP